MIACTPASAMSTCTEVPNYKGPRPRLEQVARKTTDPDVECGSAKV